MVSRDFSSGRFAGGKKWTGTVEGDRGNKALDIDTVRLLKTQDLGYLRTMRNVVAKEVTELEQKVAIAAAFTGVNPDEDEEEDDFDSEEDVAPRRRKSQPRPKKIVFADSAAELEHKLPQPEADDDDEDMDDFEKFDKEPNAETKKKLENAERLRRKLRNAKKKLKALTGAEGELELQRARMAKTATVGGVNKKGKAFKVRERKR